MQNSKSGIYTTGLCLAAGLLVSSGAAQALTTFSSGTPASAAEVNGNFTELADRLDSLEAMFVGTGTATFDCNAEPLALKNQLDSGDSVPDGTEIIISGQCQGPIDLDVDRVVLRGETESGHGIFVPVGSDTEVVTVRASGVHLFDLELNANNNSGMTALAIVNGDAVVDFVTVNNNSNGTDLWVGRNASGKFFNNNNNEIGVGDGGYARLYDNNINISAFAARGGVMESRGANNTFSSLGVYDNGAFRMRSGSSLTVNGNVEVFSSSTAKFQSPVTINGNITLKSASSGHIAPGSTISGTQFVVEASDIFIGAGSSVTMSQVDSGFYLKDNAVLRTDGLASPITINADVRIYRNSTLNAQNVNFRTFDGLNDGLLKVRNGTVILDDSSAGEVNIASSSLIQLVGTSALSGNLSARRGTTVELWEGDIGDSPILQGLANIYLNSSITSDNDAQLQGGLRLDHNSSASMWGNALAQGSVYVGTSSSLEVGGNAQVQGSILLQSTSVLGLNTNGKVSASGGTCDLAVIDQTATGTTLLNTSAVCP